MYVCAHNTGATWRWSDDDRPYDTTTGWWTICDIDLWADQSEQSVQSGAVGGAVRAHARDGGHRRDEWARCASEDCEDCEQNLDMIGRGWASARMIIEGLAGGNCCNCSLCSLCSLVGIAPNEELSCLEGG